eukprot:scaffold21269_cov119-Isochrysis_galbana.AAC.9
MTPRRTERVGTWALGGKRADSRCGSGILAPAQPLPGTQLPVLFPLLNFLGGHIVTAVTVRCPLRGCTRACSLAAVTSQLALPHPCIRDDERDLYVKYPPPPLMLLARARAAALLLAVRALLLYRDNDSR